VRLSRKKYLFKTANTTIFLALAYPAIALSHEVGDFILRLGAVSVALNKSSSLISTVGTGALADTKVGVGDNAQAGLNFI
jgi:outer membrane protein W